MENPPPLPEAAPRTRRDRIRSDPGRAQANRAIGRAYRSLKALRTLYIVLGLVYAGLFPLGLHLASQASDDAAVVLRIASVVLGVSAVVLLVAAVRLTKEPVLWSGVGAGLSAVTAVLSTNWLTLLLAAACCGAFVAIQPAVKLMRQYPELRISRKMRGGS